MWKFAGLIFLLFLSSPLKAESDSADVHFAAHFGMSYVVEDLTFRFSRYALHMDHWDAAIFSGVASGLVTTMRQVVAAPYGQPINTNGIAANVAGIGASIITNSIFRFKTNWEGN